MATQKQQVKLPDADSSEGSQKGVSNQGPFQLHEVLEEEYISLHGALPPGYSTTSAPRERLKAIIEAIHKADHAALCISGGGIRSATFGLGVIQGLARCGLLDKFDYLSTVSGGGYVGSWLTAWIERHENGLDGVIAELKNAEPQSKINPEPPPVRHLRSYSNYLSPKLGLLSADTWTLAGTVFRNLILIWLVMVPLIAAFLMIPRIAVAVVVFGKPQTNQTSQANPDAPPNSAAQPSSDAPAAADAPMPATTQGTLLGWRWTLFGLGSFFALWALVYMGLHRPSTTHSRAGQGTFLLLCFVPLFLSAASLTTFWVWNRVQKQSVWIPFKSSSVGAFFHSKPILGFLVYGLLIGLVSSLIYSSILLLRKKRTPRRVDPNPVRETFALAFTGLLSGWLLWFVAEKLLPVDDQHLEIYTCLAAPFFFLAFLLAATFFIGISSRHTDDEDREWWARAGAWMLIFIAVWLAFSVLIVYGPHILQEVWTSVIGGTSGLITILLGRSPKTEAKKKEERQQKKWTPLLTNLALALAAPLFVAFLIIVLSAVTSWLIHWLSEQQTILSLLNGGHAIAWGFAESMKLEGLGDQHLNIIKQSPFWFVAGVMAALTVFGLVMARMIDTNKFSLHAMYRNRLIRAYLGASNTKRHPNPFTGFDKRDNLKMQEIWPSRTPVSPAQQRKKLLHVVNMALNLVSGDNLAWQERKAQSFTVSPLHAGSFQLCHQGRCKLDETGRCRLDHLGYYRRSGNDPKIKGPALKGPYYGGRKGISLGTAVTISGAAASPNMGYHSSPAITFLLSLFNARLGWWLGNPGPQGEQTFTRATPTFALGPIIEALGFTNANRPFVYLSDGGHFENLGLYEMVLRRCRFIVVSDASQDEACKFQDLGGAVRKIRIDLGIPIEFEDKFSIFARSDDKGQNDGGRYCAIGKIHYACVDGKIDGKEVSPGTLIYIKPAFYGVKEPRDVYEYAMANKKFPHETTADQFFTESQFESYRILGSHIMEQIGGLNYQAKDFDDFKGRCETHLGTVKPQPYQQAIEEEPEKPDSL
jgi:Patatin-like phospholipase.